LIALEGNGHACCRAYILSLLFRHSVQAKRDTESSGVLNLVGGSPTPNHFLLFVQKKVIKENHTPLPHLPSVLAPHLSGGCGTRIFNPQTSPRRFPSAAQSEGATRGIENPLITTVILSEAKNPVFVGRQ
jgi:hypothetical protein